MLVVSIVLSVVLAVAFLGSGGNKFRPGDSVPAMARHMRFPTIAYRFIGAAEVLGAIGLLVGLAVVPLGVVAAIALAVLMVGAVGSHLRVGDPLSAAAAALVLAVLAVVDAILRALVA